MPEEAVRVLLVEDDEDDFVLTRDLLRDLPGINYRLDWVADCDEALAILAKDEHDVYLVDYRLGRRTGLELMREARARGCHAPAIMLTGQGEHAVDVEAMRAGAADYLVKGQLDPSLLERSIRYALQQKRHEDDLRKSHEELERRVEERTAALARANEALREADRRKDDFLAMLGHELRNPLAAIGNALELVRRGLCSGAEAERRVWGLIGRQVGHLGRLVDDLLDVSRINQGKIKLRRQLLGLVSVIASAVESARPLIDARRHWLELELPDDDLVLDGDPARLHQVVLNLLTNAAKYTEEGGHVRLAVRREAGGVVAVSVRDTGMGIPPAMLAHIFEPFTQAERTLDRSQGGLGIGLTLVRQLAELHGGSVSASSEGPGRGSEFVVRLPLMPDGTRLPAPLPAEGPGTSGNGQGPGGSRRRVLLVDDNRDAADSLALLLQASGHEVRTAHDGLAGLEAARAARPEVVLLDIGLPRMDGYEVARRLRAQLGHDVVLVALTGYGQADDRRRAREAGFNIHLVKPVDLDALERLLASPELLAVKG
jgi:two-component system CheB/CheR fusion protein